MASVSSALSSRAAVEDDAQAPPLDEAAFQILYRRTAPGLRSYIRRICGDIDLADDIFQETFYRFLRARPPTLDDQKMKAYLYKTATSALRDHWRRANRGRLWRFRMARSRAGPAASAGARPFPRSLSTAETTAARAAVASLCRVPTPFTY